MFNLNLSNQGNQKQLKKYKTIEKAILYIIECFKEDKNFKINKRFVLELHTLITRGLSSEGSRMPGSYRSIEVSINNAQHTPPMAISVHEYMDKLIDWINEDSQNQFALLKVQKRSFIYLIHPFDNGNGRKSRVLTYASFANMVLKWHI